MDWAKAAELSVLAAAFVLLGRIAWSDFMTLKIRNRDVVILFALLPLWLLAGSRPALPHLAVGAGLFAMTFGFWLAGKLGAGDVKLFGLAGAFAGPEGALVFAIVLLVVALVFLTVYRNAWMIGALRTGWLLRLAELIESKKVPYGVAISLATAAALVSAVAS